MESYDYTYPLYSEIISGRGNLAEVKRLIALGANPNGRANRSMVLFGLFGINEEQFILDVLGLPGINLSIENRNGSTLLYSAIRSRNIKVAKFLIENGVDINKAECSHHTPLSLAIDLCDRDFIDYLIDHGAIVTPMDLINVIDNGQLPYFEHLLDSYTEPINIDILFSLVSSVVEDDLVEYLTFFRQRFPQLFKEIIDLQNTVSFHEDYLITTAIMYNSQNALKFLLDSGVDINNIDDEGNTYLFNLVNLFDDEGCESAKCLAAILLDYGIDTTIKNKKGKTAIEVFKDYENEYGSDDSLADFIQHYIDNIEDVKEPEAY
jgi:ankyrin repeat protein